MSDPSTEHGRIPRNVLPILALSDAELDCVVEKAAAHALIEGRNVTLIGLKVTDGEVFAICCGCRACALMLGTVSIIPDLNMVELAANGFGGEGMAIRRYQCTEERSVWLCYGILPWSR